MSLSDDNIHSFIVRIWREPRETKEDTPEWRGVIEHVASGKRHYLKELDEIVACFMPYLSQMGVRLPLRWRICAWVRHQCQSRIRS